MKEIIGSVMAFRGENEYINSQSVFVEVTEVYKDNRVEIGFTIPDRQNTRLYLTVNLPGLLAISMRGEA